MYATIKFLREISDNQNCRYLYALFSKKGASHLPEAMFK